MDRDELSQPARALLEAARGADDPSAADRARIDAALSAKLAALGVPGPLGTQGSSGNAAANGAAARGQLGLLVKTLSALAAVSALWLGLRARTPEPSRTALTHAATTNSELAPAAASAAPTQAHPRVDEIANREAATLDTGSASAHAGKPTQRLAHVRAPAQPAAGDTLTAEMTLIAPAERALRSGQYADARALLEQHALRFPNGVLREERRGLHVLALCGLGQLASARAERTSFLRDAPNSVLASQVRAACAESDAHPRKANRP